MNRVATFLASLITILAAGACIQFFVAQTVGAVSASEFLPGRIIDDEIFYDKDGMSSVAEVQAFLNAHTPPCDTWGTRSSGYGGLTNAQYAQQVMGWHGAPYVCLNNYHENPNTGATSFENGGGWFQGGMSAAEIIYTAAQQYRVNPKVLLIMLRKESLNLFSDSWPLKSQYKYAMGYACPDSGPGWSASCEEGKAGFYKQVMYSAWQLRYYYNNMGTYNYAPGRWNTIQYSTNPACGTKDVYIENYATASLYIYTPYTPNNAALNAYPGTANCGAYGNRNFWFFWHEWFGSPLGSDSFVSVTQGLTLSPRSTHMYAGDTVDASFTVHNRSTTKSVAIGNVSICARSLLDGKNLDLPWKNNITIQPGRSWTFSEKFTAPAAGSYRFWICNYRDSTSWSNTFPQSARSDIIREVTQEVGVPPTLTTSMHVTGGGEVVAGKPFTLRFAIRNNDNKVINLGSALAAIRSSDSRSFDFPFDQNITLQPGQTYTYNQTGVLPQAGVYRAFVSILRPDFGWNERIGLASQAHMREITINVQPNPRMVESLTVSATQTSQGKDIRVRFAYRNDSAQPVQLGSVVAVALAPNGQKEHFPLIKNITIQPGQVYRYDRTTPLMQVGKYTIFSSVQLPDGSWNEEYPVVPGVVRHASVEVIANPRVSTSLATDSTEIVAGKPFNLKFSIRNDGDVAIQIGRPIAAIRGTGGNVDFPLDNHITIQPGSTYVYNKTATIYTSGQYRAFISLLTPSGLWNEHYPTQSGVSREYSFTVQSNPRMSSSLSLNKNQARVGEQVTATFRYRNESTQPMRLGSVLAVAQAPDGQKEYFTFPQNITVPAGETYIYTGTAQLLRPVTYKVFASVQLPNGAWNEQYPTVNSGILREASIVVIP